MRVAVGLYGAAGLLCVMPLVAIALCRVVSWLTG